MKKDIRDRFSAELKEFRLKKGLSQRRMTAVIGLSSLSQYQNMEKKGNPTLVTIEKIKHAFPDFDFKV